MLSIILARAGWILLYIVNFKSLTFCPLRQQNYEFTEENNTKGNVHHGSSFSMRSKMPFLQTYTKNVSQTILEYTLLVACILELCKLSKCKMPRRTFSGTLADGCCIGGLTRQWSRFKVATSR